MQKSNSLTISAAEIKPEDVNHIYEFSEAQQEALTAIYYRYGKDWLVNLRTMTIEDLSSQITSQGGFAESTMGVLKRRAESLLKQKYINTDKEVSTSKNIIQKLKAGKVVLVDSSNLGTRDELLISSVLCRTVFGYYRSMYSRPDDFKSALPILMVMEEAQRVLRKAGNSGSNIFARIAREGRKFKTVFAP